MLARVVHGEGGGPRVVLVHGFTQTIRSWDEVAADLAGRGFEVVLVDLPGHGASAAQRLGFVEAAHAIGETGGEAVYVGYSMGGRLTLRLALDRPDLVRSVVLVGASPGYESAEERAERRRSDARLANNLADGDTKGFLEAWLAKPLFETTTPRPADLDARRANPADGLAYALRTLGTGSQDSLWERLPDLRPPALLVAGELDPKFRAIAEQMAAAIGPTARTLVVAGAGHAVPLDQPGALAEAIAAHAALTR